MLNREKYEQRFFALGGLKSQTLGYVSSKYLIFPEAAKACGNMPIVKKESTLVFIDGFFSKEHSNSHEDIICLSLDEAMQSYGVFLQNRMSRTIVDETDPFALLNGMSHGKGLFIYVPPNREWVAEIEHFSTTMDLQSPRVVLYLGKNARVKMGQSFDRGIYNAYIDVSLDAGADFTFKSKDKTEGRYFQSIRASLKKESRFALHLYSEGSELSRTSIKVQLQEEQSEVLLQGLSKLGGERQNHIDALVSHLAPNTRSRQHFKALLKDEARSSFEGKIYVHPIAQKTEAYQLSNNLLLSDTAAAFAKPNLEIFADDVKASHGATIAQLDAEELFYLRSRGLNVEEAKECLVEGFCKELIACIPSL